MAKGRVDLNFFYERNIWDSKHIKVFVDVFVRWYEFARMFSAEVCPSSCSSYSNSVGRLSNEIRNKSMFIHDWRCRALPVLDFYSFTTKKIEDVTSIGAHIIQVKENCEEDGTILYILSAHIPLCGVQLGDNAFFFTKGSNVIQNFVS